jgi:hypothetical protein
MSIKINRLEEGHNSYLLKQCPSKGDKYVMDEELQHNVLSINNSRFADFLPLIYPPELEVKETTDTASSASFLDLYLYDFKIEVVPLIINFSTELTTVVKFEV